MPAHALAAGSTLPRMHLAAHVARMKVRRLLARKTDKAHGPRGLQCAHAPRHFDHYRNRGGIVVRARRRLDRVVVCSDDYNFVLLFAAGKFRHNVGDFMLTGQIRLPLDRISRIGKLALD